MVIALGIAWVLDGLEVTLVGSLGGVLGRNDTLGPSAAQIGGAARSTSAAPSSGRWCSAGWPTGGSARSSSSSCWRLHGGKFRDRLLARFPVLRVLPLHDGVGIAVDWGHLGPVRRAAARPGRCLPRLPAGRAHNGPEFTSRAFTGWASTHGLRRILIEPGRPMNGYIESFNGKFRDECLNEQWFETLQQARSAIAVWRQDDNEVRPHSSCGRMPPAKFAELHRQRVGDAARASSTTTETEIN